MGHGSGVGTPRGWGRLALRVLARPALPMLSVVGTGDEVFTEPLRGRWAWPLLRASGFPARRLVRAGWKSVPRTGVGRSLGALHTCGGPVSAAPKT